MPGCSPSRDVPSDANQVTLEEQGPGAREQRRLHEADRVFHGISLFEEDAPAVEELYSDTTVRLRLLLGDRHIYRSRRGPDTPTPLRDDQNRLGEIEGSQGNRDHASAGQTWRSHLFSSDPPAGYFDNVSNGRHPSAVRAIDPDSFNTALDPLMPIADRGPMPASHRSRRPTASDAREDDNRATFRARPMTRHGSWRSISQPERQERSQRPEDDVLALMNRLVWHGRATAQSQGEVALVLVASGLF
jgi:hypothetical protein